MPKTFRVIPVLDLKDGRAVHAVGGHRSHYQPLGTVLHPSADPLGIARGCRDILGCHELYLADLDAIAGGSRDENLYRALEDLGLDLWIDAGLCGPQDVGPLLTLDRATIIAGLETASGPGSLAGLLEMVGPRRLLFSIDVFEGRPLTSSPGVWPSNDSLTIARTALGLGIRRLLLLDLARVGTGRGTGTARILSDLRDFDRLVEITVGGGISSLPEVLAQRDAGASSVLLGTAIHEGRVGRADLDRLREQPG